MYDIIQQIREALAAGENADILHTLLPDLLKAADEGKIVELPCKVGNTVYYHKLLSDGKRTVVIETSEVKQISMNSHGIWLVIEYCHTLDTKDVGKTVFLTRKAAEKALKERGNLN